LSEGWELLNEVLSFRENARRSGVTSTKLVGALTVEAIKSRLAKRGFNVSHRDLFIERVPYELDLLVLREGVPDDKLIYKPEGALATPFDKTWYGIYFHMAFKYFGIGLESAPTSYLLNLRLGAGSLRDECLEEF